MDFDAIDFGKEYSENLKSYGQEWPSLRAKFNDERFKKLEKKIEQIEKNHLHHLTLENMPDVSRVIEGLYKTNLALVQGAEKIEKKLVYIKIALVVLFALIILSKLWT